jgi:hypothetical protein
MANIKKFNDYIKTISEEISSEKGMDIKTDNKQETLSGDINLFKNIDLSRLEKIDGEYTIIGIQDVSLTDPREKDPELKEAMIVNADLSGNTVKRGDTIWITAMIRKDHFNMSSLIVIKTKIMDLYKNLSILNTLPK